MCLGVHASIRGSGRKKKRHKWKGGNGRVLWREERVREKRLEGVQYGMKKDQIVSVKKMEQKRYGKHKVESDGYCHTCRWR